MSLLRCLIALLLVTALIACSASSENGEPARAGEPEGGRAGEEPAGPPAPPPEPARPAADVSEVPEEDVHEAAQACNRFAVDLYGQVKGKEGNLFFSPYSIHQALGMTMIGAAGETRKQLRKALHLDGDAGNRLLSLAALNVDLLDASSKEGLELSVANALWGQSGYTFRQDFLEGAEGYFGAPLETVDFSGAPEKAVQRINAWVARHTRNRIRKLLRRQHIQDLTRLILTNAVYFKGFWKEAFKEKRTRTGDFHLAGGGTAKVPLMRQSGSFRVAGGDGARSLVLPYRGGRLAMIIILPGEGEDLASIEEALTPERVASWATGGSRSDTDVTLPRFEMTCSFDLKGALSRLGLADVFRSERADFSGMTDNPKGLYVTGAVHKAFVKVNEKGTEAAAVTAMPMAECEPRRFRVDRPFLFAIQDRETGAILFLGRCLDPRQP